MRWPTWDSGYLVELCKQAAHLSEFYFSSLGVVEKMGGGYTKLFTVTATEISSQVRLPSQNEKCLLYANSLPTLLFSKLEHYTNIVPVQDFERLTVGECLPFK